MNAISTTLITAFTALIIFTIIIHGVLSSLADKHRERIHECLKQYGKIRNGDGSDAIDAYDYINIAIKTDEVLEHDLSGIDLVNLKRDTVSRFEGFIDSRKHHRGEIVDELLNARKLADTEFISAIGLLGSALIRVDQEIANLTIELGLFKNDLTKT